MGWISWIVLGIFPLTIAAKNMAFVVYEEDLNGINKTQIDEKINETGNSTKITYYAWKKANALYEVIQRRSMIELLQRNEVVVSYLERKESHILHEALNAYGMKHFSLSPQDCHFEFYEKVDSLRQCDWFTSEEHAALTVLLQHLKGSKMAILSSDDLCSSISSSSFMKEISKMNENLPSNEKIIASKVYFSTTVFNVTEIEFALEFINIMQPKVILLLSPISAHDVVLKVAAKKEMLWYKNIWIIPGIRDDIEVSLIPMQLITIRRKTNSRTRSMLTSMHIVSAVKFAEEILLTSSNREKQVKLEPLSSSLPCRNNFSVVEILAKTERKPDWIVVYRKDENSSFQYFTNNGLVFSVFASLSPKNKFRVVTILEAPFTIDAPYLRMNTGNFYDCAGGIICRVPENTNQTLKGKGRWRYSCCIGYAIDLLSLLMAQLNFDVDLYVVEDGFYGSLVNGSFNGMIGDVERGKADIAVAGVTITSLRSSIVDFTSPFMRQDVGIVTMSRRKEFEFINWQFASKIDKSMLVAVYSGILLGTFLSYILENKEITWKRIVSPKEYPPRYSWLEGFTYYSGLTFQRDLGGKNPGNLASRVVAIGFAFGMLVVMTTYTAVLTATKVSQQDSTPFLGIKDTRMTNPTPSFRFATVPSTSIEGIFKNTPDESFYRMYLFMQKYNVKTVEEGINKVKSGELHAFIHEYPFLLYFLSKQTTCELQITGEPIGQSGFALALKKGSSWTDKLSSEILSLKESGRLAELSKKWLATSCLDKTNTMLTPESLSLEYFGGLVVFIAICIGSTFVLLLLEYVYRKYPRKSIAAFIQRFLSRKGGKKIDVSQNSSAAAPSLSNESNNGSFDLNSRAVTNL